ncbi:uncharacterized protein LOC135823012 [Sycon ciliatum]|uniref:uncharacterized protein LOC135823012 n=1 Tax=Sycon ciliatum TaxID=27933 RepID=UPI0031F6145F
MSLQDRYQSTTSSYGLSLLFIFCVVMEVEASREEMAVGVICGTALFLFGMFFFLCYYLKRRYDEDVLDADSGVFDLDANVHPVHFGAGAGSVHFHACHYGPVHFQADTGTAQLNPDHGVDVEAGAGNVDPQAHAGNVDHHPGPDAGNVDLVANAGAGNVDFPPDAGNLDLQADVGNVDLKAGAGSVDLHPDCGSIQLEADAFEADAGNADLEADAGNADLEADAGNADLDADVARVESSPAEVQPDSNAEAESKC